MNGKAAFAQKESPKLLWRGNWSSGTITVPDLEKYCVLIIKQSDIYAIVCKQKDGNIHDSFGFIYTPESGEPFSVLRTMSFAVSGNQLTYEHILQVNFYSDGYQQFAADPPNIEEIYGVC